MIHHKNTVHLVNRKGDTVVATLIFFNIPIVRETSSPTHADFVKALMQKVSLVTLHW